MFPVWQPWPSSRLTVRKSDKHRVGTRPKLKTRGPVPSQGCYRPSANLFWRRCDVMCADEPTMCAVQIESSPLGGIMRQDRRGAWVGGQSGSGCIEGLSLSPSLSLRADEALGKLDFRSLRGQADVEPERGRMRRCVASCAIQYSLLRAQPASDRGGPCRRGCLYRVKQGRPRFP